VALIDFHRSAAGMSVPNISFKRALSSNPFGMSLGRWRFSTNSRSARRLIGYHRADEIVLVTRTITQFDSGVTSADHQSSGSIFRRVTIST
jgi:hypothetical protein